MNQPCLKLTAYFGERQRAVGNDARFLADALFDVFGSNDVAASVMLRGIASFGSSHELRTDVSLSLSEDPAVAIAAVDVEPKIRSLVDEVAAMTGRGLVTLSGPDWSPGKPVPVRSTATTATPPNSPSMWAAKSASPGKSHTWRFASYCTNTDSPVPLCFSAWTARRMASVTGRGFSAATSTFQ